MPKTRPPPEIVSLEVKKIALEQAERALRDTLERSNLLDRKCVVCLFSFGAFFAGVMAYIPYLWTSGIIFPRPDIFLFLSSILAVLFSSGEMYVLVSIFRAYKGRKYHLFGDAMESWKKVESNYHTSEKFLDFLLSKYIDMIAANTAINFKRSGDINQAINSGLFVVVLIFSSVLGNLAGFLLSR